MIAKYWSYLHTCHVKVLDFQGRGGTRVSPFHSSQGEWFCGLQIWYVFSAFRGMHVSPAKYSSVWLPRKCDYRTDAGQSDPYVSLCFVADTKMLIKPLLILLFVKIARAIVCGHFEHTGIDQWLRPSHNCCKRKRKRSDSVLWQKPLHQQKCQKGKVTTQTTPQKSSIKQRLRTDLGRSVGVTTATQLVWLTVKNK